jgi:hypothetical protein
MGLCCILGDGNLVVGDSNLQVGVGTGTAKCGSNKLPDNCPWFPWTGVEGPFPWRGTLDGCSGVLDRGLHFFLLALLGTEVLYAKSDSLSALSLSPSLVSPSEALEKGTFPWELTVWTLLLDWTPPLRAFF